MNIWLLIQTLKVNPMSLYGIIVGYLIRTRLSASDVFCAKY